MSSPRVDAERKAFWGVGTARWRLFLMRAVLDGSKWRVFGGFRRTERGGGKTHAAGVAFRQVEDAVEEVFRLN